MRIDQDSFYKWFFSLLVMLLAASCNNENKPKGLLNEVEMTRVLVELHIYEEKINQLGQRRDSAEKIFELAKPIIFQQIGVSDSVFKQSYNYYAARPEKLERIYASVVDSLNLREQRVIVTPAIE